MDIDGFSESILIHPSFFLHFFRHESYIGKRNETTQIRHDTNLAGEEGNISLKNCVEKDTVARPASSGLEKIKRNLSYQFEEIIQNHVESL